MGKIVETRNLYKETIKNVTKSLENWQSFLDSSSWNFKYDFDDQILIYAQRYDAKACATIEEWNKKLRRWVNKGTKPIYVFDKNPYSDYPFKLVFDLSDTHNYNNTEYKLWTIKEEYEKDIIDSLEASFGDIDSKESLAQAILVTSYNMVTDNIEDYLTSIIENKFNSKLQNFSDEEIRSILIPTVWASVSYMMMTRCGIDAKKEIQNSEFSFITNFDKQEIITTIGASVSDIAEMGLREIARTVNELQKNEKLKNRTFENKNKEVYDEEKFKGGTENDRENRVHETGRLLFTKSNNEERESPSREIFSNEVQLSEKSQKLRINQSSDERETNGTSSRNSENSERQSELFSTGNGEKGENRRELESSRPDEMGELDEQLEDDSGGDGSQRVDLRLEEKDNIRQLTDEEMKSDKDYLKDEYQSMLLSNIQNLNVTRNEIKEFYKTHQDIKERVEYIKKVFSNSYTEIVVDDVRLGYKTYENVLHLWKDDYLHRTAEVYRKWNMVADYIEGMILVNEFNDLHKPIPTYDDQMQILQVEAENAPTFLFTQEIIDYALIGGSNFSESKMRIYNQFENSLSSSENIKFLKNEYGWGGSSSIHSGTRIGIDFDGKGITLHRGYEDNAPKITLNWNQVEKRISELIKADRYLNSKEKDEYSNWLKKQEQERELREAEKRIPHYEYHLGDTVYIGADEYEISGIKDGVVTLYDPKFPLFSKEMDFDEFERKVKENYSNAHLIVNDNGETKNNIDTNEVFEDNIPSAIEITTEQVSEEIIKPKFTKKKSRIQDFILHPEVLESERNNFKITDNDLGVGTPKEKFERNIEAIKVLKRCENENRYATKEEQEILSKYVGWGGLQQAFDEHNNSWNKEYTELKELLTDEEYKNARTSVLTAFYTPPVVISSIYEILQNMGLKNANILEPSCRSWKFFRNVTTRT